jgi:hypothetical protein
MSKRGKKLAGVAVAAIQARYGIQKSGALMEVIGPLCEAAVGGKSLGRKLARLEHAVRVLEAADAAMPSMPPAPHGSVRMDPAEWLTRLHRAEPQAVNGHDLKRESNGQATPQWHPER